MFGMRIMKKDEQNEEDTMIMFDTKKEEHNIFFKSRKSGEKVMLALA